MKQRVDQAAQIPCDCGSRDATWHGDTMRVYCCDVCWKHRVIAAHNLDRIKEVQETGK